MAKHDEALKQVNRSGFPFQLRVEQEVLSTKQNHHWSIASRENAWRDPDLGSSGFIDLVLKNDQNPTLRLVIECKRMKANDSRQLRWVFLEPDRDSVSTKLASCLEIEGWPNQANGSSTWADVRIWDNVHSTPTSRESEFCILPNDEQRRQPILESLAVEVLESIEGLAQEEVNIAKSQNPPHHLRLFIFPAIVTNADLVVCRFNSSLISISDGTLDNKDAEISSVPFIRFRKNLATDFPQGSFIDLQSTNRARERTIFVVKAVSLTAFLTGWTCSPLDLFDGYALEKCLRQRQ